MANILITGANGQLGCELARIMKAGYSVLGELPSFYNKATLTLTDAVELNITDLSALRSFFTLHKPDIIVNCAAKTNVDACESEPEDTLRLNAYGVRNLAIAAHEAGAKLVHVSTDYVFPGDATTPICEWDTPDPRTVYGKSKLLGETYAARFCPRSFVVRTAWLYGRQGPNFVQTILRAAREKGVLSVVNDQRGNPTNAEDLAHHLLTLAATEHYGLYHCVGLGDCTWYDFACKIVEYASIPCQVDPCTTAEYPRPAPRPAYSVIQNLGLDSLLMNHMRPWQEALKSYICDAVL